jgi:hypothetical protein
MTQATNLPGGAQLAPGETPLVGDRFMFSTIAFYLHTDLVLTNRRLYAIRPNAVLGLIPAGTGRSNYPIENIAGVSARTRFDIMGAIFGSAGLLVGLAALSIPNMPPVGLLLVLLGLAAIIGAPKQAIEIMNSGGGVIRFPVSIFERGRPVEYANSVSEALARTARGGAQERSVSAPPSSGSASDGLRRLQNLKEQGLITESEYATTRAEILARL